MPEKLTDYKGNVLEVGDTVALYAEYHGIVDAKILNIDRDTTNPRWQEFLVTLEVAEWLKPVIYRESQGTDSMRKLKGE